MLYFIFEFKLSAQKNGREPYLLLHIFSTRRIASGVTTGNRTPSATDLMIGTPSCCSVDSPSLLSISSIWTGSGTFGGGSDFFSTVLVGGDVSTGGDAPFVFACARALGGIRLLGILILV